MRTIQRIRKRAPRLLLTLTVFLALSLSMFAPIVSADTTSYTAAQIETWLVDQISNATVVITDATAVILNSGDYGVDPESNYMRVDGVRLNVLGVSIGFSPIKFMFEPGTTNVLIRTELDLFGISPKPKVECTATVACIGPDGPLEITGIDAVKVGSFVPTLSDDDLAAIVDVINQIIVSSELTVSAPSASLTGISVVDDGNTVELTWSEGAPTYLEAADILAKVNGMAGTLETKATSYLQAGESDWTVTVNIVSDTRLEIDASFTAFGVTAKLDVPITFSTLTATITNATFTIGDDAPKTVTFSAEALVGCSNYIPYITMQSFVLGDEHPGLRDYVASIVDTIMTALDDAVDDIVAYTTLDWPYYNISDIAIVGTDVVLTSTDTESIAIDLQVGWNMVSVPVVPDDASAEAVFPDAIVVYTWEPLTKSYTRVYSGGALTTIEPERSYWVAMISADTLTVAGTPVTSWDSDLSTGWNMTGSVYGTSVPVDDLSDDPPDSILTMAVYHWNPGTKSYDRVTTSIDPSKGYWLAATAFCVLHMP